MAVAERVRGDYEVGYRAFVIGPMLRRWTSRLALVASANLRTFSSSAASHVEDASEDVFRTAFFK